ncbi:MAG: tetratricopeptide repeat protein [Rhodospirillaceae bacterium]|nr:tetratricopeptide repeat protein [Rhodospirillaceae bacterium]
MTTNLFSRSRVTIITMCLGVTLAAVQAHAMGSDSSTGSARITDYAKAVELIDDEEYSKAIPLLKKSIREKGDYADALNQLGFAYRKSGNWKVGMEYYLKALALEPNHLGANEYLGELYLEEDDLPNAEKQLVTLQKACGTCDEYEELAEAIEDYKDDKNID